MKKVIVGGFHHESDTFNPIITCKNDIHVKRGCELLSEYDGGENSLSGIVDALKGKVEIIPTLFARAVPGGIWDKDYYLKLKEEMLMIMKNAFPFDAIALALHGSMRIEEIGDAEADLLSSIKALYPDIPIFATLDMHAILSDGMIKNSDALVGYKCAPHTDTFEIGKKVGLITLNALDSGIMPHQVAIRIPFLVAGEQSETNTEPMKTLIKELKELELKDDNIIAASYTMGFPWSDCKENGAGVIVASYDDKYAKKIALKLANRLWDERFNFKFCLEHYSSFDAIEKAKIYINSGLYPIVISDSGDNPTAGSSQDVTSFLEIILKDKMLTSLNPPLCYNAFYDPEIVHKAFEISIGGQLEGLIGGKFDKKMSQSIPFVGKVKSVYRGYNGASLALINISGVDVVVTDKRMGCYECDMMRVLGVNVDKLKLLIVKLGYLEPELKAIAKKGILALTKGSSDEIFTNLEYKNIPHPIYPIDEVGDFEFIVLTQ